MQVTASIFLPHIFVMAFGGLTTGGGRIHVCWFNN